MLEHRLVRDTEPTFPPRQMAAHFEEIHPLTGLQVLAGAGAESGFPSEFLEELSTRIFLEDGFPDVAVVFITSCAWI